MNLMDKIKARCQIEPDVEPARTTLADTGIESPKEERSDFRMFSNVLHGEVDVVYPEDRPGVVLVDGVAYRRDEIETLTGNKLDPTGLRSVHETKRFFDGKVMKGEIGHV